MIRVGGYFLQYNGKMLFAHETSGKTFAPQTRTAKRTPEITDISGLYIKFTRQRTAIIPTENLLLTRTIQAELE